MGVGFGRDHPVKKKHLKPFFQQTFEYFCFILTLFPHCIVWPRGPSRCLTPRQERGWRKSRRLLGPACEYASLQFSRNVVVKNIYRSVFSFAPMLQIWAQTRVSRLCERLLQAKYCLNNACEIPNLIKQRRALPIIIRKSVQKHNYTSKGWLANPLSKGRAALQPYPMIMDLTLLSSLQRKNPLPHQLLR